MSAKYSVSVLKWVQTGAWHTNSTSSGGLCFARDFVLSFPPVLGLELHDGIWFPGPVISVRYDIAEEKFFCHVAPDTEIEEEVEEALNVRNASPADIDALVAHRVAEQKLLHKAEGWELLVDVFKAESNAT